MEVKDDMPNFLEETVDSIKESGHTPGDIEFIGNRNRTISLGGWDGFAKAIDRKYDDSYGLNEVADDLAIFFRDHSVMFRHEYDGAEWWEYIPSNESHTDSPIAVMYPEKAWCEGSAYSLKDRYGESLKEESEKAIEEKVSKV